MGRIVRALTGDASAVACVIDSTDMVAEIARIHGSTPTVTAALGRLASAGSMMGYGLKSEQDELTLRINGGGEAGNLIVVANYEGDIKAYVANPAADAPLNENGKLNVRGVVGTDGSLVVIKDLGLKEPYVGQVPIVSGEIAEDITYYYAISEQVSNVCGLGVLVNPDGSVKQAGGYIVQLLPFAEDSVIDQIEKNYLACGSVTAMMEKGMTPEQIALALLDGLDSNLLDEGKPMYACDCSRERISKALISMGEKELTALRDEQEETEVCCHFCDKKYKFTRSDITQLLKEAKE